MSPDDGKDGPVMSQALSSGVFGGGGLRDGYLHGGVLLGCPCIVEGWVEKQMWGWWDPKIVLLLPWSRAGGN